MKNVNYYKQQRIESYANIALGYDLRISQISALACKVCDEFGGDYEDTLHALLKAIDNLETTIY